MFAGIDLHQSRIVVKNTDSDEFTPFLVTWILNDMLA